MPIEIRELLIKTAIRDGTPEQNSEFGSSQSQKNPDPDAIIAACVEQVLAILQEKAER